MIPESRPRRIENVAAALLVVLGLAHLWFHTAYTLDDAYISYRYSRNLARGLGLVYSPGEYIKGYSNTLYTLLMTAPELFGFDPNPFSKIIGLGSFAYLCWLIRSLYTHQPEDAVRERLLWALALLAGSTPVAVHFTSGLETGFYTTVMFAAVVRRLSEQRTDSPPWSAALFAAALLTRPEGALFFCAMVFHDIWVRVIRRRVSARDIVFYVVPPLVYVAELVLSASYYGSALPQTYYAKTSAVHGMNGALQVLGLGIEAQLREGSYLAKGLSDIGAPLLLLAALPLTLSRRRFRRRNAALLLVVMVQLVFIARAGEDWAPGFRFGVPMLPALIILSVELIGLGAVVAGRFARPVRWMIVGATLAITVPPQLTQSQEIQQARYVNAENKLAEGAFFATLAPPGSVLSSFDIGGQGYAAGGFDVLDTGGLVTRDTVGCRGRRTPQRCVRYASLVLPDLVRLHGNPRFDGYIGRAVRQNTPYLLLDRGRYLLRRSLVLGGEPPDWSTPPAPVVPSTAALGVELVGLDVAPAARIGQSASLTLFWRRVAGVDAAFVERQLEWEIDGERFSANASHVLWRQVDPAEQWNADELFTDFITARTPGRSGHYQLQVVVAGRRLPLLTVDVLDEHACELRAADWLGHARKLGAEGRESSAVRWYERAEQLSATARGESQRALADYARRIREDAERHAATDLMGALRRAQQAKRILHRSYWESGGATAALRGEIEANAAMRAALIARELAPPSLSSALKRTVDRASAP